MQLAARPVAFPSHLRALVAVYFVASLAHFAHNAEYIAYYPNMPGWITRETVYVAWLTVTCVGLSGLAIFRLGLYATGAALVGAYGALGLDSLTHYTLALCSEHTLAANLTIWVEATTGVVLLLCATSYAGRRVRWRRAGTAGAAGSSTGSS